MPLKPQSLDGRTLDSLLLDLGAFKQYGSLGDTVSKYLNGEYKSILRNPTSQNLYEILAELISNYTEEQDAVLHKAGLTEDESVILVSITGLAAFNAFLQANVTGPPLDLGDVFPARENLDSFRHQCLKSLDIDGVSVYQHIPYIELFCLARLIFTIYFPRLINSNVKDSKWMRLRINAYHQRLLSGLSGGRLSDSTALQDAIEKDVLEFESEILGDGSTYSTEAKVQFSLEKAQIYIMQGLELKAKQNVQMARTVSGFSYALSGALGKRTKFQRNDISQLVVFARSKDLDPSSTIPASLEKNPKDSKLESSNAPEALDLNDDTLLESIAFTKSNSEKVDISFLPSELANLQPDAQPQLQPLDQITLLTEATLKDSLSPLDKLSSEVILPYAVRVLSDKPTNWQIYTQALLVRSRIESHRSRTQERSILQLQVIVDQIIADTQEPYNSPDGLPEIRVTQFFPRAKASESAPVIERLKYIYQLNTPTRWELETELAYAWSGAGSFVSALEIFKRLKLWAEVALCYHSTGQEGKARQVVRRQLFYSSHGPHMDMYDIDAAEVAAEKWDGEMRSSPAHAPRLWCILGDLDQDPTCWQRAWEISGKRYARAQRTLGDYFTKQGKLHEAREAYMAAAIVNRQNNDTWSRLGDVDLGMGNWDGAIIAFQQSIMIDDTDAKTYSNLGSALLSKHAEMLKLGKGTAKDLSVQEADPDTDDEDLPLHPTQSGSSRKDILHQALLAYKRGAALAHTNWKIWDNVLTLALRFSPPSFPDLLLGFRAIIKIRAPSVGEDAIDIDILRILVQEVISRDRAPGESSDEEGGIYVPPRGSLARATVQLMEEITPLITKRFELWYLVEKLCLYRRDYVGALGCAEKAWRMSQGEGWLEEVDRWGAVVAATENLVSAYENYGPMEVEGKEVERGWRMKARSAVRGVMGKAKDVWEGTGEWEVLERRLEELKSS